MDIVLASRNPKKIREMEAILSAHIPGIRILSLDDVGFVGDIEEDGTTYEENALIKATTAMEASGRRLAAIADDSGLSVDALGGAPGVYSARYAGGHGDDAANNALLIRNLADVPPEARTARFVCCIACVFPDGRRLTVRGETVTDCQVFTDSLDTTAAERIRAEVIGKKLVEVQSSECRVQS